MENTIFLSTPIDLEMPQIVNIEEELEEISPIITPEPIIEETKLEDIIVATEEVPVLVVVSEPITVEEPPKVESPKPVKVTKSKKKPKPKNNKGWVLPNHPISVNQNPNHSKEFFGKQKSFGKEWGDRLLDFGKKEWWIKNEEYFINGYPRYIQSKLFKNALEELKTKTNRDGDVLMNTCKKAYFSDYITENYDLSQDVWLFCQKV